MSKKSTIRGKGNKKSYLPVILPGFTYDNKGRIFKTKWTIDGKKKNIIIVKDSHGKKIARTTKNITLKQAKQIFQNTGSLSERRMVSYGTNVKAVDKRIKRTIKKISGTKEFQVLIEGKVGRKKVYASSSKSKDIDAAIKEAERNFFSRFQGFIEGREGSGDMNLGKKNFLRLAKAGKVKTAYYSRRYSSR